MKRIRYIILSSALALLVLLPGSLMAAPKKAKPIVVRINDVPNGQPVIQVHGAPNGYDIYTGDQVNNPDVEDGALITLFGVDQGGSILDWGGRFMDPSPWELLPPLYFDADPINYRQYVTAVDIVWVQHDYDGPFFNGDLQVGFNSAFPGTWYINPEYTGDANLGPVTDQWVTVYADDILVVQFKPHTYRSRN